MARRLGNMFSGSCIKRVKFIGYIGKSSRHKDQRAIIEDPGATPAARFTETRTAYSPRQTGSTRR
jgi:hypothetical protein